MTIQVVTTGANVTQPDTPITRPSWVRKVLPKCAGCHDDFYNSGGQNCDGKTWCWSMQAKYAGLKGKPPCYH